MTQNKTVSAAPAAVSSSRTNGNLSASRKAKRDEYFTRLEDIENELRHYRQHFRGKTVLLNCDDPETSNFWFFFSRNFDFLGLERLISTHYTGFGSDNPPPSYVLELRRDPAGNPVDPTRPIRTDLKGDGDFRSPECIALLEQSDIVVTNPPFSLFREYVAQLAEHDKKFLILGNLNAVTYKEIWPLIQMDELWFGVTRTGTGQMWFRVPDDSPVMTGQRVDDDGVRMQTIGTSAWFTNLDHDRRHEELRLFREYSPEKYPRYDNYDAINVDKVVDIPVDYDGAMGVPITFLGKHNPEQFEIIGCSYNYGRPVEWDESTPMAPVVGGKNVYKRIIIRSANVH